MTSGKTVHAYLFEVRSIQPFLFATGKLKDLVAGSELLDYLCNEPLQKALEICGLQGYASAESQRSPRCAGSSFYILIDDAGKAQRLQQVWPLLVSQLIPGVEQVDALVSAATAKEAIKDGLAKLRTARNRQTPLLPPASPLTERSPRTGNAAIAREQGESLDEATRTKRQFDRPSHSLTLAQRFSNQSDIHWPINFEPHAAPHTRFPLREGDQVALVHADGNGLGEILRVINQAATQAQCDTDYVQLYRAFSDGLNHATVEACRQATAQVLLPKLNQDKVMPARPLVLGGDDLTVLVRADLAIAFTEAFIQSFEQTSAQFLMELQEKIAALQLLSHHSLPGKLTACAGVAFMKPNQPFAQCYALAESLCDRAKKASRQAKDESQSEIPSSIAFHRIQVSLIEDADVLFEREMQAQGLKLELGLPAYGVGEIQASGLARLDDLKSLAECFGEAKLNDKRLRALATLLHVDVTSAKQDYRRWRELAQKTQKNALADFDRHLQSLLGEVSEELPANLKEHKTVLADLLAYLHLVQPWKSE